MQSRLESLGIAALAVVVMGVPAALYVRAGGVTGAEALAVILLVAAGVSLMWWRTRPRQVCVVGSGLLLLVAVLDVSPPETILVYLMAFAALTASSFEGRAAWPAALATTAYVALLYLITGDRSIGLVMVVVPGYLAGTVLRLRRETAQALSDRAADLEHERELLAEVSVRNERARIAAELHDIVGHALSVMVIQAAAGQRLASRDPDAARVSLDAIAESARQGREDLRRLVDLLEGTEPGSADLALVDEVVQRAARTGLQVTCRWEGDRDGVGGLEAHAAFRVVQEGLTNALRYAPGSRVRVLVRGEGARGLLVRVENDPPLGPVGESSAATASLAAVGSGRGLAGLRERVSDLGGTFHTGPMPNGGWCVLAHFGAGASVVGTGGLGSRLPA